MTKTFGLPLECANLSGYYSKLLFMMLWPIVVVATLIAGYVLKQWYQLLRANRREPLHLPLTLPLHLRLPLALTSDLTLTQPQP